jgi:predicted acyltransferase
MGDNDTRSTRMKSVDVFRGMTIVAMILVNNPGSIKTTY